MFCNTFVNPIALGAIVWRYYIVFIVVLLAFGVNCILLLPRDQGLLSRANSRDPLMGQMLSLELALWRRFLWMLLNIPNLAHRPFTMNWHERLGDNSVFKTRVIIHVYIVRIIKLCLL